MLRRALDAAEEDQKRQLLQQQQQQQQQETGAAAAAAAATETTALGGGGDGNDQHGDAPAPRPSTQRLSDYGATTSSASYDEDTGFEDDEDEEEEEDDDEDDEYWQEEEEDESLLSHVEATRETFLCRIWGGIKSAFLVVANVENLYDSDSNQGQQSPQLARRNSLIVFFWFVVLATTYTSERSTFKLLVDRAGPFRLFAVEMVTATHAILLGTGMLLSCLITTSNNRQRQQHQRQAFGTTMSNGDSFNNGRLPLGIPVVDVGVMALLDIVNLLLVFLTGIHVPPTLTVILVQFTLPLTAIMTQFTHPNGRCNFCACSTAEDNDDNNEDSDRAPPEDTSHHDALVSSTREEVVVEDAGCSSPALSYHGQGTALPGWGGLSAEHVWGSLILCVAVILALIPALIAILDPDLFLYADTIPLRTAYNSLLYAMACAPAAASQLYKEHVFIYYKQPVNMNTLNLLLSVFQFIFASILAPLVFCLQGLGATSDDGDTVDWTTLYPSRDLSRNFWDGLLCFFRILDDDDQENKYPEEARCDYTLGLTILHAFSIIAVGVAVDKIVNAGATKVMYRGISAGIILAVLCLHAYDMSLSEFNYGPIVDGLNLACLLLLILGSEVYHRVSLQESTFQTVYPTMNLDFDDDD